MHMVLIDYDCLDLYVQINDEGAGEGIYALKSVSRPSGKCHYKEVTDLFIPTVQEAIFAKGEEQHRDELEDQSHE
jgi:hypothetical protein